MRSLSGGEKARLLLARLMARESNILVLDEPTNDLDVETLDLLQELLDDYDGTVLLVSHDRDFLDRVASMTVAMEGDGRATVYAGGWSDYQAQKAEAAADSGAVIETENKEKSRPKEAKPQQESGETPRPRATGLTYVEQHRLKTLPSEIERLEAEIARLEEFLSDPELFSREPAKFAKASEALAERQQALSQAEDDWLTLEEKAGG